MAWNITSSGQHIFLPTRSSVPDFEPCRALRLRADRLRGKLDRVIAKHLHVMLRDNPPVTIARFIRRILPVERGTVFVYSSTINEIGKLAVLLSIMDTCNPLIFGGLPAG